jgi:hypothetical protein
MEYDYVETSCDLSNIPICDKYADAYSIMKKQLLEYIDGSN